MEAERRRQEMADAWGGVSLGDVLSEPKPQDAPEEKVEEEEVAPDDEDQAPASIVDEGRSDLDQLESSAEDTNCAPQALTNAAPPPAPPPAAAADEAVAEHQAEQQVDRSAEETGGPVNEDPVVRWGGSSSATGISIEPQTTLHIFHLERRPAPTRQADEHHHRLWHHRPEQESAKGSASSGPRGARASSGAYMRCLHRTILEPVAD